MKHADIEKLEMIKIFPPAKEDWNVLYVELGSDSQVDMVMAHTRYMVKKDHRVVRWYPKQMYERYRAVEAIAYEIRRTKNIKTRVKIGKDYKTSYQFIKTGVSPFRIGDANPPMALKPI